jgi:ribosomal protein S18 acetylase RimI-like enzyme
MNRAKRSDKEIIVNILTKSFDDNKSVNYIINQDRKRSERIRGLMGYSYDLCELFGDIFITEDKTGCALVMKPELKNNTLKSILLDAKFAIKCLGLGNIKKAMSRESKIKQGHPKGLKYYLWFIGVEPTQQNMGIGSKLMRKVIEEAEKQNRTICLETSTLRNLPWYEKFGFSIYHEFDFGYKLYCLKRE